MIVEIPTYDPKKKKNVLAGFYDRQEKTFYRYVKPEHYMKIVGGYGIQEDVVQKLIKLGCSAIKIKAQDGIYFSEIEKWLTPDIRAMDFGHGKQRFLPLVRMTKEGE